MPKLVLKAMKIELNSDVIKRNKSDKKSLKWTSVLTVKGQRPQSVRPSLPTVPLPVKSWCPNINLRRPMSSDGTSGHLLAMTDKVKAALKVNFNLYLALLVII